jgi:hypothetical protein
LPLDESLEEEGCRRREFKAQAAFSSGIQGRSTGPVRASSVAVREILELDRRGGGWSALAGCVRGNLVFKGQSLSARCNI